MPDLGIVDRRSCNGILFVLGTGAKSDATIRFWPMDTALCIVGEGSLMRAGAFRYHVIIIAGKGNPQISFFIDVSYYY